MEITVREASHLLRIPEEDLYRWIEEEGLPAHRVQEQYHLNRAELQEWITARGIEVPVGCFEEAARGPARPGLRDALERGGIVFGVRGDSREEALRALLDAMPLPASTDRALLLGVLQAREALASTGIGDGIAIPHVRSPMVLSVERPFVTLGFLERAVEFGSIDGRPVHTLFSLVCPTVRSHLQILSRLAFALREAGFLEAVRQRARKEEILRLAGRVDAQIDSAAKGNGA